jgi:hypothetical protein
MTGRSNTWVQNTIYSVKCTPYDANIGIYIQGVSKPMSQTFPGYFPPPLKKNSSYQYGSKSEQVPRYPLLCRNPRNAVIRISAA